MGSRNERRGDLLALEAGKIGHAGFFRNDELLGVVDVVENPYHFDVEALRRGRRRGRRADFADRDVAGRHRLDDVAAAAEHLPVDLVARGLLIAPAASATRNGTTMS